MYSLKIYIQYEVKRTFSYLFFVRKQIKICQQTICYNNCNITYTRILKARTESQFVAHKACRMQGQNIKQNCNLFVKCCLPNNCHLCK